LDSLSQALLGSAVAVIATRGKMPRRAIVYGAIIATLPDLDVLQPFDNDVETIVRHRTWSHSWIVHVFAAPVIAAALYRLDKTYRYLTWWLATFLVLFTHAALDAFTIYGTGLFWPLDRTPVMGGSIFIIDPLYTLPLLVALVMSWKSAQSKRAIRFMMSGLLLSCAYLGWGQLAQQHVEARASTALQQQGLSYTKLIATPSPFNSVLWRIIALDDDQYHEGFYHFLENNSQPRLTSFPRNLVLKQQIPPGIGFQEFSRFNHDYYALSRRDHQVIASDLRMGIEPFYFFRFIFAEQEHTDENFIPEFASIPIDEAGLFRWLGYRLLGRETGGLSEYLKNKG